MNPRIFRYGVFGVGRIGKVHARLVQEQGHTVVALGDENPAAVAAAQAELGLTQVPVFHEAAAMAQALGDTLDAVIVSSHTKSHAKDALPFVQAGVPVYLEKPLTDTLAEAFDFVEAIGTNPYQLQIGLQRRFDPALLHTKAILESGVVGEIREIRCVLRDQLPPPTTYISPGLLIDMGIHVADEAIFLTGEFPSEVWASVHHARAYQSHIEEGGDTAFVTFTTPSGVLGRLDLSRTHASGYNNETYIIGSKGTIHTGRFAGYPGEIPVEVWLESGQLHPASQTFPMTFRDRSQAEFLPRFHAAYGLAHERFRAAVEAGEAFVVTQNEVLDAQVFVEAAHLSAQRGGAHLLLAHDHDLHRYRALCEAQGLLRRGAPTC